MPSLYLSAELSTLSSEQELEDAISNSKNFEFTCDQDTYQQVIELFNKNVINSLKADRKFPCNNMQFKLLSPETGVDTTDSEGLIFTIRGFSNIKGLEEKEKQLEGNYRALFHNHPDAVFRIDTDGTVIEINKGAERMFGFNREQSIGHSLLDFVTEEDKYKVVDAFTKVLAGESVTYQSRILHQHGQEMMVSVTLIPVTIGTAVIQVQGIAQDITQVYRADLLLKQQNEIQSSIFESLSDSYLALDENYCYTYINKACSDFLARDKKDLLHKNIIDCFPLIADTLFIAKCREVFATNITANFSEYFPFWRKNLHFNIARTNFGIAIHFRDITDQLNDQQNLKKLSLVANKISNGVIIADKNLIIEWVNYSFTKITGYTAEDVCGHPLSQIFPYENILNRWRFLRLLVMLKYIKPFSQEIHLVTTSGKRIWVNFDISPVVDEEDNASYFIVVISDITLRKQAEFNLQKQANDVFRQNRDLEQFTYIVSHNLRAPISSALGCSNVLSILDKFDPEFNDLLVGLNQSLLKLDTVVKDINTILSVRKRHDKGIKRAVHLKKKCLQVYNDLKEPFMSDNSKFEMDIPNDLYFHANPAYIYSIFYNLVSNAVRFKSAERILHVKVSAYINSQYKLIILVSDNGIGIDLKRAEDKIFKLYSRINNTATQGEGIGLFLVKNQVEALGGTIKIKSRLNEGTEFIISFPTE